MLLDHPVLLRLPIRPNDYDRLGHVNNAVVLEYLEAGRWAWLAHVGVHERSDVVAVVSRIEVDYRRELLGTEVVVQTRLIEPATAGLAEEITYRAVFEQRVFPSGSLDAAASARVTVGFIDVKTRTLTTLQEFVAAITSTEAAS